MTHLENYLDILKTFPNETQRNLNLITLLDEKSSFFTRDSK